MKTTKSTPDMGDDVAVLELPTPSRSGVGLATYAAAVRVADVVLMFLATLLGWDKWAADSTAAHSVASLGGYLVWALPIVVAWYVFLEAGGAYDLESVGTAAHELRAVFVGTLFVAAATAFSSFVLRAFMSRSFFAITFLLGVALLLLSHFVLRWQLARAHCKGLYMRRVVAVGARGPIASLVSELERSKRVGLEVVAACVPDEEAWEPIGNVRWVLPASSLHEVVRDTGAGHVFLLSGAGESPRHVRRIAWSLEGTDAQLAVVPHLTDIAGGRIRPRPVAGLPLIELEQPQLTGIQATAKRALDFVASAVGLLLLSPLLAVVAFLIKREDGGPVFFVQERVGRDGGVFGCYKFRSMYLDADKAEAELRAQAGHEGARFKLERDPRITRIGAFIRKYSIDELPQLFNVLRGDMSLVGPRPQQQWEVETYHPDMTRRLKVRPGMTGLWQVSGRSDLTAEESERLDLYYVDNWSMSHDLLILARTIRVVLTGHGAY